MHFTQSSQVYASTHTQTLHAQCHDRIDNVIVILLQGLDSLLPRDRGLRHDQFNVLGLHTGVINFLTIILVLLFVFLSIAGINGLALAMIVRVVVASVGVGISSSELRSCVGLSLRIEVFNLGLAKDTVRNELSPPSGVSNSHPCIAGRRSVDFGIADNEEDL